METPVICTETFQEEEEEEEEKEEEEEEEDSTDGEIDWLIEYIYDDDDDFTEDSSEEPEIKLLTQLNNINIAGDGETSV